MTSGISLSERIMITVKNKPSDDNDPMDVAAEIVDLDPPPAGLIEKSQFIVNASLDIDEMTRDK